MSLTSCPSTAAAYAPCARPKYQQFTKKGLGFRPKYQQLTKKGLGFRPKYQQLTKKDEIQLHSSKRA